MFYVVICKSYCVQNIAGIRLRMNNKMDENKREEIFKRHFRYYKMLERDLFNIEEYIEIEEENFGTYSLYFVKVFQSICGEMDSLFKVIYRVINENERPPNIGEYQKAIMKDYRSIANQKVRINNGVELIPWESWREGSSPKWWRDYNSVKHNRLCELDSNTILKKANLKNVLYALTGLYILNRYAIYILFNENENKMRQLYLSYKSKRLIVIQFCHCYKFFMGYNNFDIDRLKKVILDDNSGGEVNGKE